MREDIVIVAHDPTERIPAHDAFSSHSITPPGEAR
jgi:hypothetical protein